MQKHQSPGLQQQQPKLTYIEQNRRSRTAVLPKRSWIQRNPRLFSITFMTTSLLVLFSKPLYDIFLAQQLPPPEDYSRRRR